MAKNILKDIEDLASEEEVAARSAAMQLGPIRDSERWDYLAQEVLLAPRGRLTANVAADAGRWGCAVDKVPLLRQLLIYPSLIVDLRPYRAETDLANSFGVTLNQLLRLADAGHILINVYEFESQRKKKFKSYLRSPCIEKILKHPNCRIHSIRREEFFRSIAVPEEKRNAARSSAWALFEEQVVRLAQQHPNQLERLTRCRDAEGAMAVVTEAYLYLEVFGADRPEVGAWLSTLPKPITISNINQVLVELLGIKWMLANPYTAAFGGFSTYTEGHIERMAKASWVLATQPERKRVLDPTVDAGLRYIQGVLRQLDVTDDINTHVPSLITNRQLNNFLGLLRDYTEVQNEALGFLELVRASVGDNQKTLSTLEGWAKAVAQVRRAYDRIKWLATGGGALVGGVTGYGISVLTGGDASKLNMLFAALGMVAGTTLRKKSEEFLLAKLLSQNKCQIVDRLNKFQQWAR